MENHAENTVSEDEKREQDSGSDHGEDTVPPAELEARNTRRSTTIINIDAEKSTVINAPDGGYKAPQRGMAVSDLLDRHFNQMVTLLKWIVVLMILIVVALFLWRIGSLAEIVEIVYRFSQTVLAVETR